MKPFPFEKFKNEKSSLAKLITTLGFAYYKEKLPKSTRESE